MHTHTIQTKFMFGDRVRFDSKLQGLSGSGTVFEVSFGGDPLFMHYTIELGNGHHQPGILEDEIMLIEDDTPSDTPTTLTSP